MWKSSTQIWQLVAKSSTRPMVQRARPTTISCASALLVILHPKIVVGDLKAFFTPILCVV